MKIFFDTEFTGLHKETTLISIGLVSEEGTTFYAELIDYNKSQVDEWIQNNVIDNLLYNNIDSFSEVEPVPFEKSIRMKGDKETVGCMLRGWLQQFDTIEWVSDVCHYDFVLLIDLLYGHALEMPYGIWNSACHDINQDIAKTYNVNEIEAFDKSREEILKEYNVQIYGEKHNSLYDAKVIKAIYNIVR